MRRAIVHTLRLCVVMAVMAVGMVIVASPASACGYQQCIVRPVSEAEVVSATQSVQQDAGLCFAVVTRRGGRRAVL